MLHPVFILLAVTVLTLLGFGVYLFLKTLRAFRRQWQHRRQRRAAKREAQAISSPRLPEADSWKVLDVPTYLRQQRQRQADTSPGGVRF